MRDVSEIDLSSELYPQRLVEVLGKDSPKALKFMGNLSLVDEPGIGFCGSRKATEKGLRAAYDCASMAVENGCVVISGNATGVDMQAHRAALECGGASIFVLPEGISRFRIKKILREFWSWERVLIISQWDVNAIWRSYQAMARNNTIIGLSNAMVVIEAGPTGGTLHAGEKTLIYGLPLFVLEYRDMSIDALGNAELLRKGGIAVRRSKADGKPNLRRVIEAAKDQFGFGPRQSNFRV